MLSVGFIPLFDLCQPERETVVSHSSFNLHFSFYEQLGVLCARGICVSFSMFCLLVSVPLILLDCWSSAYWFVEVLYLLDKLAPYEFKYFDPLSHLSFLFVLIPFCDSKFFSNFLCKVRQRFLKHDTKSMIYKRQKW